VTAPEALLLELAANDETVARLIGEMGPLMVPFDMLADIDGWFVDLSSGQAAAMFDDPSLVVDQRAINAALVAVDYGIRRGAESAATVTRLLEREGPISCGDLSRLSGPVRNLIKRLGLADEQPASFARRARGHALSNPVQSDPALSFEERAFDHTIGNNALSSLLVHTDGDREGVRVDGMPSDRWAVEVGLPPETSPSVLDEIEREVALMPSFMRGLSSALDDDGIVLGWREGGEPDAGEIGRVIQAWTQALFDLEYADVLIVFGPPHGPSDALTQMRGRADRLRGARLDSARAQMRSTNAELNSAGEVQEDS
jgi:hypothetical protein